MREIFGKPAKEEKQQRKRKQKAIHVDAKEVAAHAMDMLIGNDKSVSLASDSDEDSDSSVSSMSSAEQASSADKTACVREDVRVLKTLQDSEVAEKLEEAKRKAEADAKKKAEADAKKKAEEDAKKKAEKEAKNKEKADKEAQKKVAKEAKKKAEKEAKKKAAKEAKKKAEEDAKKKAEEGAKKKAEEDAKKKAEEVAHGVSLFSFSGAGRSEREGEEGNMKGTKRGKSPGSSDSASSDDSDSSSKTDKKKQKKRSKSSESDSKSSDDSDSRSKKDRKKRKERYRKTSSDFEVKKSRKRGKQYTQIYEGDNFLFSADDEKAVRLHPDFAVYVKKRDLDEATACPTLCNFIRKMVDKIYTPEALLQATPSGMPARGKGEKYYRKRGVPPRLHPDGFKALFAKAGELEDNNKLWRPRTSVKVMKATFSSICCTLKAQLSRAG